MPAIKSTYSYGSKSQNKDGLWYLDHDSEMWMIVVEQLVLDSKSLLVGKNFDDADPMERPFKRLNDVLVSANDPLTITKGIHQRLDDPHITFLINGDDNNAEYEFHLQLSAELINRTYLDGEASRMFLWKPSKLSLYVYTGTGPRQYASYPVGVVARTTGRARGFSITEGQIESHVEGVNKYIAAEREKERLLKEEEDRKQQVAEEEQRKKLTPDNFPLDMGTPKKVGGPKQVGGPQQVVSKPKGRPKFVPF